MRRLIHILGALLIAVLHGVVLPYHLAVHHGPAMVLGAIHFVHSHDHAPEEPPPAGPLGALSDASDFGAPHRHHHHDHSVSDHLVALSRVHWQVPAVVLDVPLLETGVAPPHLERGPMDWPEAPPPRSTCLSAFSLRGPPTA